MTDEGVRFWLIAAPGSVVDRVAPLIGELAEAVPEAVITQDGER